MCVVVFLVTVDFHSERLSPSKLSFFFTMEKMIWLSYGGVSLEVLGKRLSGGRRRWRSTTARLTPSVRESPIFIPSSLTIPVAHAYAKTHTHMQACTGILLNGRGPPAAPKHGIPHLFVYASFSFPELY